MKIFYDGLDIEKYAKNPIVKGFTTNCTFFSEIPDSNGGKATIKVNSEESESPLPEDPNEVGICKSVGILSKNYTEFYNVLEYHNNHNDVELLNSI